LKSCLLIDLFLRNTISNKKNPIIFLPSFGTPSSRWCLHIERQAKLDALFFVAEDAVFDRINKWEISIELGRTFHSQKPWNTTVRYEGIDERLFFE
jgi:hypothetical protein